MRIPPDFRLADAGVLVRRGYEGELSGWRRCARDGTPVEGRGGRGGSIRTRLPGGAEVFVRRYRHGGLLGGVFGEAYFGRPPRPWRELVATEAARRSGIVAPEVLAAWAEPLAVAAFGVPYRGVLVTRALHGRRLLRTALLEASSDAERRRWIGAAVEAIRRLHHGGIRHPDLNVTNLLVGESPEVPIAIIDFDRAVVGASPVGLPGRWMARRRLLRSIGKLALPGLSRVECRRLVGGVASGEAR